jgi:hypothetical protein
MFRKGFSLIEVNMAILIAAGGLLALFTLFPVGLRQSEMSSEDLYQATYAASVLQMLSGNIATIYSQDDWDDVETFWDIASEGTGLPKKLKKARSALNSLDTEIRDQYLDFQLEGNSGEQDNVWYVGTDFGAEGGVKKIKEGEPSMPEQYILRLFKKKDTTPAVYVVSFVSSSIKAPSIYYQNSVYSMEFTYYGKVWTQPPRATTREN